MKMTKEKGQTIIVLVNSVRGVTFILRTLKSHHRILSCKNIVRFVI